MTFTFKINIDPSRLDEEWIRQPELYHGQAELLANAKRELDLARRSLEVVKAETALDVRRNPKAYDLSKVTEATVEATVEIQKAVNDANERVINAKHAVEIYNASCNALDHRKRALEKLVSLYMSDYYATPKESRESRQFVDEERRNRAADRIQSRKQTHTKKED